MPPTLTQAPQTITVTSKTSPIRLGSYPAPYLILNTSVTDTVWIGDNPSVATGFAVPLYPGAKLRRTVDGDVFAILDNAATAPVTVILAFTVDQWDPNVAAIAQAIINSGTLLVDSPIQVVPPTTLNQTTDNFLPSANGLYDVRTLQSVFLSYFIDGVHLHAVNLTLTWYGSINATANDIVGLDQFQWSNGDTAQLSGEQIPVRGSYLRIDSFITGGGGLAVDTIQIAGSHRPWSHLARSGILNRVIGSAANGALGTGASLTITPGVRYDGPVTVTAVTSGAAHSSNLRITDLVSNNPVAFANFTAIAYLGTNVAGATLQCIAPRNSWTAAVQNGSAGNVSATLAVLVAPEGT